MKLVSIQRSQAIRLIRIINPPGGLYMPDVVRSLQEKYGFAKIPRTLEEYNVLNGVTFEHGKFVPERASGSKEIVIDKFQVFENGVLVNTRAYVEEADIFLDDVIKWSIENLGSKIDQSEPILKIFNSDLEITSDISLDNCFPKINSVGKQISELLKGYGLTKIPLYNALGVSMHFDTYKLPVPIPAAFTFARRDQKPYSSNLYYSTAPLVTSDHLGLLKTVEKIAKSK